MAAPKVRFTTGGTVQAGGGVYLKRSSDEELLQACQEGIFTYVLTSRQMFSDRFCVLSNFRATNVRRNKMDW